MTGCRGALMGQDFAGAERHVARVDQASWPASSFLARLGPEARDALTVGRPVTRLAAGQPLMVEGEPAGPVFLLLDAVVKVTMRAGRGEAFVTLRVGGDIVGEMAVLDGGPRSATVTVLRDRGTAVTVPGEEFMAVMRRYPAAGQLLAVELTRRLRAADRRWVDLTAHKVEVRVARVLARLADDYAEPEFDRPTTLALRIGITQRELATLVGAKESAVGCALKKLEAQNIVTWNYRAATINDAEALRLVATQGNCAD